MLENDNELKREPIEEIDRFSRLMLGSHNRREPYQMNENTSQEFLEQPGRASFNRTTNRMDGWLFGFQEKEAPTSSQNNLNQIEGLLNQIDLMQLMETVDMFVATTKQLQPLFNDFTPYFKQLAKKFKAFKEG
ncbi:hypothetical protein E2K98_28090 [Bacillus salipaludis]|uniref:Uncharacterized protein n=1 Tax=Bacillus salipaludis TaxID=2547811 RepID=A0A4R5VK16_9BACI|nr:hypothetical protein [Bacillus salipaludis]MDQ6600618.1 hypothetical protein [Bacillus salipaludis]TDK55411.1 hypothetical protein E2K98_28090 [Bacillus salipaludis]